LTETHVLALAIHAIFRDICVQNLLDDFVRIAVEILLIAYWFLALLELYFETLTQHLTAINSPYCLTSTLGFFVADKPKASASSFFLVGHDSYRKDAANTLLGEVVEEIQVVPLIGNMEDEEVCALGSLLVCLLGGRYRELILNLP